MKAILNLLLTGALFFLSLLLSSIIGALCGLVVGLIFGPTILGIFAAIGITGFKMWQIGAFLGFVGGFFRTSITQKS
ncbi:MAG: hypothetical protein J5895_04050 [Alphaproteobacteria bacterium]|nr:hypothetical protein [Alphaproteobacteria bacterium]